MQLAIEPRHQKWCDRLEGELWIVCSCEQFSEHVHALVRLELLDTDLRERAFAHARICGNCSSQLVEAQALAEASDKLRDSASRLETPLFVEAGLLLAFRGQHGEISRSQREQQISLL